ncbi:MAG: hypothetical protein PGN23_10335 [Sphingomonas adhaesiva]|uniref:hypothetical protein n=1 Tax=Sphingomonas adhaesiva TaxID=28212 RepID=UPI002FFB04FB
MAAAFAASPAAAEWHEATSTHFVVYSDDTVERLTDFTTNLERFDRTMRYLRQVPDVTTPAQRVTVYVVRNIGAVAKLAGSSNVAGFYVPRVQGSVAFVPRSGSDGGQTELSATAILQHEYAHHFMFDTWGGAVLPTWFVEGFAEFNAPTRLTGDKMTVGAPPLYRAYGILDTASLPMKELLTRSPDDDRMTDQKTQTFYGRAWLLTHYLSFDRDRAGLLDRYLAALNNGKSATEAAAVFGDLRKLDNDLDRYVRQRRLAAAGIPLDRLDIKPVTLRPLTAGEAASMPVRIRSTRGVDAKSAPGVAVAARKVAASYPDDARVQVVLAEAEYDCGRFQEADDAAARALTLDPKMTRAMMYRGMAQQAMAARDKVADPERWRLIRRWFTRVNAVDHDDPWPLVAFYFNYRAQGIAPPRNAEDGLLAAHVAARYDRGVALTAAMIQLQRNDLAEARKALRTVAYDPHGGGMAAAATKVLALLDANDAKGAAAALTNASDATEEADDQS